MSLINKVHGMKGRNSPLEIPFYGLALKLAEKIEKNYLSIKKDFRNTVPGFNQEYGDSVF